MKMGVKYKKADKEKLAEVINSLGMQKVDIAEYLGVSERTIYRWLSGDRSVPRMVFIALESLKKQ